MGKSTLAINLAGALSADGRVVLMDKDVRVRSCLQWATLAPLPFEVLNPQQAAVTRQIAEAAYLIVDSEGRPAMTE